MLVSVIQPTRSVGTFPPDRSHSSSDPAVTRDSSAHGSMSPTFSQVPSASRPSRVSQPLPGLEVVGGAVVNGPALEGPTLDGPADEGGPALDGPAEEGPAGQPLV